MARWLGLFGVLLLGGCQPPTTPVGELTRFDPPNIQVLRPPRLRTPPASLVLSAPLSRSVDIVPRMGHAADVLGVDVRADGELAVSASRDGTVKIWDLRSGALLRTVTGVGKSSAVLVLGDGRRMLTAGQDGRLRIWALATGQLLRSIAVSSGSGDGVSPITALAVAPKGRRVAVADGTGGGTLAIYDLETGARERQVASTARVGALSFTVDGDALVSGDDSGALKRYDAASLELVRSIAGHAREITALDTSRDGHRVLSASADGRLKLWDVLSGALLSVVPAHSRPVRGVAVSHDAKRAVSASEDGTVKLWDLDDKRALVTMTGHAGAVTSLAAVEGEEGVITGGADGTLRLWDFAAGEAIAVIPARDDAAAHASLSASGRSALSVSAAGEMRLWDLAGLSVTRQWQGGAGITAAALSPDASQAISAATDSRGVSALRLFDIDAGRVLHTFDVRGGAVTTAAFSPRGLRALTGGMLGSVQLWGTAIRRPLRQLLGHTSPVRAVAISDDGRRGLTSAVAPMVGPDRVKLWDLDTGDELMSFDGYSVGTLTAGGREAVVGSRSGSLAVIDLAGGAVERTWPGHDGAVRAVAADRRGRVIASGDEEGLIKIWDNSREKLVRTLGGHRGAVHTLSFSADSRRVMSASEDGTLRVWRIDNGASVSFIARGDEWLAFSDDGFYAASPRGAELAYAVSGLRGFRLDQLAALHNRPELLLERVGGGAAALMEDFAARHRRRLRAMGATERELSESYGSAPGVAIEHLEQRGRLLTVGFRVASDGVPARYQLLLNGVPWFSVPKPVASEQIQEQVILGEGRNHIEIEVVDQAGARAIPASHVVRLAGERRRGALHYIGIGVSRYRHDGLGLKYAHRDAVELGRLLESATGAYREVHVHTLVDAQATKEGIATLAAKLAKAEVDDTVVLFIAGQWAHTRSLPADPVFLPHDGEPERLAATSASVASLAGLLTGIAPRRRLMIVDGCVSGDRDEQALRTALAEAARRGLSPRTSGALGLTPDVTPRTFLFQDHRMMLDAAQSGAVVLRASRGAELCYELDDQKSGALTAAVLRALSTPEADADENGWVDLAELQAFVGPAVANMTGGLQHPVLSRGGVEQEIRLPRVREVPPATQVIEHPLAARPPPGCGCRVAHSPTGAGPLALAALLSLAFAARRRRP